MAATYLIGAGDGAGAAEPEQYTRPRQEQRISGSMGTGGGHVHDGAAGTPGGAIVFARTATTGTVPCDAGGHEIEVESTETGMSGTFALFAAEADVAWTLAQPSAATCD